nr:MSMEG_1061 family FMN-dependent PPOX-type flavoprotein [Kribbella shirazensis]
MSAIRALIGEPSKASAANNRNRLDKYDRLFLAKSPFLCLGTAGPDGEAEVSSRGDPPGFVRVLDDRTLFIPERPGNRRADTLGNLLRNPGIALMAFVPGMDETLRIRGRGRIVTDPDLLVGSAINGKRPKLGIVIEVARVTFHCGKAIKRSSLWSDAHKIDRSEFPSLAQILYDQRWGGDVDAIQREIDESYRTRMY